MRPAVTKGWKVLALLLLYAMGSWGAARLGWAEPLVDEAMVLSLVAPFRSPEAPAPPAPPPADGGWVAPAPPVVAASASAASDAQGAPPGSWEAWLAKLQARRAGRPGKLRVLQLGDSELVADGPSREVRTRLQAIYGDGGVGFVPVASPVRYYDHSRVKALPPRSMFPYRFTQSRLEDTDYGPVGIAFRATAGARGAVELLGESGTCHLRLHYARLPGGGDVKVTADGKEVIAVSTQAAAWTHAVAEAPPMPCPKRIETKVENAPARLFGFELEREGDGLVWSTMGVLGARIDQFAVYGPGRLEPGLAALRPDLLVINFGLNRAAGPWRPPDTYVGEAAAVLKRMRAAVPAAACLVIAPYPCGDPAHGRPGYVSEGVSLAQREAAKQAGCAFMDRFTLAGGASQIGAWRRTRVPVLSGDYTHLTNDGAARMGQAMSDVLLAIFEGRALPPQPLSLTGPNRPAKTP